MLEIREIEEVGEGTKRVAFPLEYREYREGVARVDDTPTHRFERDKAIKYEELSIQKVNLGDEDKLKIILVGDDWNPVVKAATFKIFMEYKDVFAWMYKELKGIPLKLCVHRIPLVLGAQSIRKALYRMNKSYAAKVNEEIDKMLEAGII